MANPLIDILMATYNGERYVGEQIESIQAQTYQNWRLFISDDCSGDRTLNVIRSYAAEDKRISIVSEDVRLGGAKENFFALMSETDADYVMFCDQDDVWLPEKVEKSISAFSGCEDIYGSDIPLLVFCDMKVVDGELKPIHDSYERMSHFKPTRTGFEQLLPQNVAAGCTMLINRPLLDLCLSADGSGAELHDWWAMLVASAFGHIIYIDESLVLYRQHGSNSVGASGYSPFESVKNVERMVHNFFISVQQAESFEATYAKRLNENRLRSLQNYIKAYRSLMPLRRVFRLCLSGCWKEGGRKLGQVVSAIIAPRYGRKWNS